MALLLSIHSRIFDSSLRYYTVHTHAWWRRHLYVNIVPRTVAILMSGPTIVVAGNPPCMDDYQSQNTSNFTVRKPVRKAIAGLLSGRGGSLTRLSGTKNVACETAKTCLPAKIRYSMRKRDLCEQSRGEKHCNSSRISDGVQLSDRTVTSTSRFNSHLLARPPPFQWDAAKRCVP